MGAGVGARSFLGEVPDGGSETHNSEDGADHNSSDCATAEAIVII